MKTNESYELDISKPGQETRVVVRYMYRLNMEVDLQSLFGLHVTSYAVVLIGWDPATPAPFPRIWTRITRGRYWSAKIDDISLWPPGGTVPEEEEGGPGGQTARDHALRQRLQQDRVRTHRRPQLGPPAETRNISPQIHHEVAVVKRIFVHKIRYEVAWGERILVHKFATKWHGLKRILVHKFATRWQGETNISSQILHAVAGWNE